MQPPMSLCNVARCRPRVRCMASAVRLDRPSARCRLRRLAHPHPLHKLRNLLDRLRQRNLVANLDRLEANALCLRLCCIDLFRELGRVRRGLPELSLDLAAEPLSSATVRGSLRALRRPWRSSSPMNWMPHTSTSVAPLTDPPVSMACTTSSSPLASPCGCPITSGAGITGVHDRDKLRSLPASCPIHRKRRARKYASLATAPELTRVGMAQRPV